jgi:hypothetical protein
VIAKWVLALSVKSGMGKRILWIDGVGGFALCEDIEVSLGQASPESQADLTIRGELSRNAAIIQRVGEDHVLRPLQESTLNGAALDRPAILFDQAIFSLGRVELRYVRPTPLSSSARIELLGSNRWQPLLNAAILLGESCVLGPGRDSHIVCPTWSERVVVFRNGQEWMMKIPETANVKVDGAPVSAPFPLVVGQKIRGDEISMILE